MTGGNVHFDGGCSCTALRYRLTARPLFVHCCHCRWCQRETGSAFVLNALIENSHVQILKGVPSEINTPTRSGKGQKIARCPVCAVALWSHYAMASSAICFLRVGTLDTPEAFPPDVHIYTSSKQPWVILPPDVPAVTTFYNANTLWSEESLARRAAVRGKKIPILAANEIT